LATRSLNHHNLTRLVPVTTAALRQCGLPPPSHRSNTTVVPPPPPRQPYFHLQAPQNPIHHVVPPPPPLTMYPTATLQQQLPIPPPLRPYVPSLPPTGRLPDMWENEKVEIICAGLKPPYDGTPDKLIPTLNLIHIRRQNEVWSPATYIFQDNAHVDLVLQFSKVTEATVLTRAKNLWDAPDASIQSHTRGTPTYTNRLLGLFLMNSLTADFATLLHSRIDAKYCADGPLLLFTLCQNIHRNHLAFVESVKTKIQSSTLQQHNNDVPVYLRFLNDNIKLIASTGANDTTHNDLIPHILNQLRSTTIPLFLHAGWQRRE